jgi:hypothetical protein
MNCFDLRFISLNKAMIISSKVKLLYCEQYSLTDHKLCDECQSLAFMLSKEFFLSFLFLVSSMLSIRSDLHMYESKTRLFEAISYKLMTNVVSALSGLMCSQIILSYFLFLLVLQLVRSLFNCFLCQYLMTNSYIWHFLCLKFLNKCSHIEFLCQIYSQNNSP